MKNKNTKYAQIITNKSRLCTVVVRFHKSPNKPPTTFQTYTCDTQATVQHRPTYTASMRVFCLTNRARPLYNNISMLFLFPVKDKLSAGVNATFNASCYG